MMYYRFTYNGKYLKEDDFLPKDKSTITEDHKFGFGLDSEHYRKVYKTREQLNLPVSETERYDNRTGYYIDGSQIDTKLHPYHNKTLIDTKGNMYIIDTVCIQHYLGKYMQLSVRKFGSQSHKTIIFENYTSKEPETVEAVKKNQKEYKLIDKVEYLQSVDHIYDWFNESDWFNYDELTDTFTYKWDESLKCNIKYNKVYINDKVFIIEKYEELIDIKKYCQNF